MVVSILVILAGVVLTRGDKALDHAQDVAARATMQAVRDALSGSAGAPGYLADMQYVPGFDPLGIRMHDLLSPSRYPDFATYDPVAQRGWRGPYLTNAAPVQNTNAARRGVFPLATDRRTSTDQTFLVRQFFADLSSSPYGQPGELAVADPWGNPIIVQTPTEAAFDRPTLAKRVRYTRIVSAGPDGILSNLLGSRLAGLKASGDLEERGDDLVLFINRPDTYEDEE